MKPAIIITLTALLFGSCQSVHYLPTTTHYTVNQTIDKELYISNHDQTNPKKVAFYYENLHNVVIDGKGQNLVFHGTILPFVVKNCSNLTLRNFSIDFATPYLRQLQITEVDSLHNSIKAQLYPQGNYKIENEKLYFTGEDYQEMPFGGMVFAPNKHLAYRCIDVPFSPTKIVELAPNEFYIEGMGKLPYLQVGERFVLRTYSRPTPAIFVTESKNITLENITVHNVQGMGLLAQLTENMTLDKFRVAIEEGSERFFTTQADATHFSACKGKIRSVNGLYEGMADDAINVHGTYLKVITRENDYTIKAQYMHPQSWGFLWGNKGDQVQFVAAKTMETIGDKTYKIHQIKAVDKPTEVGAKIFEITFDKPLPAEVNPDTACGVENLTWTPKVLFKNNIVRNNRARGALFSTPKKVMCSNNLFDHTHGAAILLCGDCNGWYETGACRNVSIKNNHFVNALTANYQFTNAIISIYPEIPNLEAQQKYFHSNIRIEDNVFETFDEPILYAKSVENLIYRNNKIIKNEDFKPFHWNKERFKLERAKNVKIQD
ncbi:alpha-1,3-galactosidase-related protein [Capnocytophaga sputigena]|uniref:alpha-1,3-galactosidase-related protein n=1 Tax=Capnocytophaga sputigena TaxID=1019 RepID=UPI00288969E8|nr:alpha-1,3-galactosidase B [Capnocytophaga sputigena]